MLQAFPDSADMPINDAAEAQTEWLKAVVTGIRTIRGEANIKPSQEIPLLLQGGEAKDRDNAAQAETMLARLTNVTSIEWLGDDVEAPLNALSLVGELKVMVPLAGLIDLEAERGRIGKEVGKAQQELEKIEKKLGNESLAKRPGSRRSQGAQQSSRAERNPRNPRGAAAGSCQRLSAARESATKLSDLAAKLREGPALDPDRGDLGRIPGPPTQPASDFRGRVGALGILRFDDKAPSVPRRMFPGKVDTGIGQCVAVDTVNTCD